MVFQGVLQGFREIPRFLRGFPISKLFFSRGFLWFSRVFLSFFQGFPKGFYPGHLGPLLKGPKVVCRGSVRFIPFKQKRPAGSCRL